MTELQKKIQEELGSATNSGVEDLSQPAFIETEIRSVERGLKTSLYLTLFFIGNLTFQVFDKLVTSGEVHLFSTLFLFSCWAVCFLFLHNWMNKKRRLAYLKLLLSYHKQELDYNSWLVESKNQFWGWLWKLTVGNSKALNDLERKRQTKRLFFLTNIAMVLTFLFSAYLGNTIMVFTTPILMLLSVLTFLDWQIHSYYFKLINLQFYEGEKT